MKKPLVVTLSIPFCPRRCSFCALPVHTAEEPGAFAQRDAYAQALVRELESMAPDLQGHEVQAIRLTGGTPTACTASSLAAVLKAVRELLGCANEVEIGVQTLPGTVGVDSLAALRKAGVTRFELGADTLSVFSWETLGRPVAMGSLWTTLAVLEAGGLRGFDARVLYGLPGQTARNLDETIDELLGHGARHIRLEGVPVASGTPFERHFIQGKAVLGLSRNDLRLPDAEQREELCRGAMAQLEKRGLAGYAPHCFAMPGGQQRYEVCRGSGCDFVTLGCSGVSRVDGLRTRNTSDLARYVANARNPAAIVETVEDLTLGQVEEGRQEG